jgi:NAD+ synthase (glutamine-hydrolysing)
MARVDRDTASVPFRSPYAHGFVRVAAGIPRLRLADPERNAAAVLELAVRAHELGCALVVTPELGLTGYSIDDLHHQDALLDAARLALRALARATARLRPALVVGLPLRVHDQLFNVAAVLHGGRVRGLVPKSYLPTYREYYETRHFAPARAARTDRVRLDGEEVPFGPDLLFVADALPGLVLHVEICEDLWVPLPPSTWAALAGATVLANLSASNTTIGKADYRRALVRLQSARCLAAYVYAGAGLGESTTDLAWDGHALIAENYDLLAESHRYRAEPQLVVADVDLDRLRQDRQRTNTWQDQVPLAAARPWRRLPLPIELPTDELPLLRPLERFPYVPSDPRARDERCAEVTEIQIAGLRTRLEATGIERVVLGVSGGLDSTQALLVAAKTMDRLGRPRDAVLAYSLPGFATSERTRANAHRLMEALGVRRGEIDIRPATLQLLRDIGHPFAAGQPVYDVTFENAQAGQRAATLFRLANLHQALLVGTSDLSELALGWTTYGVGDHMAHYHVNASVPKTLLQYLVRWAVATRQFDDRTCEVLQAIVETAISPELVPGDGRDVAQRTEDILGPYALHDFFLYYLTRFGYRPSKIVFLAEAAWGDPAHGRWPDLVPDAARVGYDRAAIVRWLRLFLARFFAHQFKRSALPNAPKVGSGGSLSPRGDWRMPSDAHPDAWLADLEHVPVGS